MNEQVIVQPSYVEFRTTTQRGSRVVRVYTTTTMPRVMAFVEKPDLEQLPMSLFWDQLEDYVQKALELRRKKGGSG